MCSSCAARYGIGQALVNQTLVQPGFVGTVPSQTFVSDVTYSDFMLYRCLSEGKFLKALATVKEEGNSTLADKVKTSEDVKKLASYADQGIDIKKWNVDLKKLLGSIKFDQSELNNTQCKLA